jgi:hypothetical protein
MDGTRKDLMHLDNPSLAELVRSTVQRYGAAKVQEGADLIGSRPDLLGEQWDRVAEELLRIGGLEDDWDGQGARAPDPAVIHSAVEWAKSVRRCPCVLPAPQVVPGVDGEVLLVWQGESYYLEAEFSRPDQVEWMLSVPGQPTRHGMSDVTATGLVE